MEEKNFEVNEDGEEEEVDESSTSFKKIVKIEDKKTVTGVKKVVKKQHLKHSHYKDNGVRRILCFTKPDEITVSCCYQQECSKGSIDWV